jgi:hypothetical protein
MELSPCSEAANCACTKELPNILWNPKVKIDPSRINNEVHKPITVEI